MLPLLTSPLLLVDSCCCSHESRHPSPGAAFEVSVTVTAVVAATSIIVVAVTSIIVAAATAIVAAAEP